MSIFNNKEFMVTDKRELPDYFKESICDGLNSKLGCGDNHILESDNSWAAGSGCRVSPQDDCSLHFGCGDALFHSVGANTIGLKSFGLLNLNRYVPIPHMPLGGNLLEQKQIGTLFHLQDEGPGRHHYISTVSYNRRNERGEPEATGSWSYLPQRPSDWEQLTTNQKDNNYFPYPVVPGNVNLGLDLLANHASVSSRFRNIIPIKSKISWNSIDLPKTFHAMLYKFQSHEICHVNFAIITWQDQHDIRIVLQLYDGTWLPNGHCIKSPKITYFIGNNDLTTEKMFYTKPNLQLENTNQGLILKYETTNNKVLNNLLLDGYLDINKVQF